ncbi:MAG: dockerin type I domain-containing protein [Ruminococcus sp.]|nr:dockerin type I domain-containing protein [Ruminococcus sp.]
MFDKYYQAKEAFYAVADTDYEVGSIQTMTAYYYDGTEEDLEKALEMGTAQPLMASAYSDVSTYDIYFKAAWNEDSMVIRVYDDDSVVTSVDIYGSAESQSGECLSSEDGSREAYTDIPVSLTGIEGSQVYLDVYAVCDIVYALSTTPVTYDSVFSVYYWNNASLEDAYFFDHDEEYIPICGIVTLAAQPNYAEATKTETAIEIDGVIDDAWANANTIDVNNYSMGSGTTGVSRMLWDEDYIYILTEVTDPILSNASANAYEQDTVEVFFDENNNKTSSYEEDDIQVRVSYIGDKTVTDGLSTDRFVSAASVTADGYLVEIAIPNTLGNFSVDQIVGFDVQVNDDGTGDGTRTSIANWNDLSGMGYTDPSGFGVLKLVDDSAVVSGTTTTTTTGDTITTTTTTTTVTETDTTEDTTDSTATETMTDTATNTETAASTVLTSDVFYGDVNLDGTISLADVILFNKANAGSVALNEQATLNADCDGSGSVSTEDALVLLRFLVQLVDVLPYTG